MAMQVLFSFIAGTVYTLALVNAASAVEVKKGPSAPVATKGKASALTAGECGGLGGKVDANVSCKSGSGCYRVDQDGVVRMICITAEKK